MGPRVPPSPTPHGCKFGRASSAGPSGPTTSSPDPPTSSELGAPLVPPASTNNQQPRGGWNGNGARQVFYPPRVTKPGVFATLQRPLTALDSTVEIERAQMESGGGRVEVLRAGRGDFMRRHERRPTDRGGWFVGDRGGRFVGHRGGWFVMFSNEVTKEFSDCPPTDCCSILNIDSTVHVTNGRATV
eukprot:scaffold92237_cov60-Phaeocystis_antarctica.AAC.1